VRVCTLLTGLKLATVFFSPFCTIAILRPPYSCSSPDSTRTSLLYRFYYVSVYLTHLGHSAVVSRSFCPPSSLSLSLSLCHDFTHLMSFCLLWTNVKSNHRFAVTIFRCRPTAFNPNVM